MTVSRRTIDDIKTRIQAKIKEVEATLPTGPDTDEILEKILTEKGFGKEIKAYKKALADYKKAEAARTEAKKTLLNSVGIPEDRSSYYFDLWNALGGSYNNPYKKDIDKVRQRQLEKSSEGQELIRLRKLYRDVGITLDLAGSGAEVKKALKEIVEQIGD